MNNHLVHNIGNTNTCFIKTSFDLHEGIVSDETCLCYCNYFE